MHDSPGTTSSVAYLVAPRSSWGTAHPLAPLGTDGRRQARSLAQFLRGRGIGGVITSPERMCRDTVDPLACGEAVEPQLSESLRTGRVGAEFTRSLLTSAEPVVACARLRVIEAIIAHLREMDAAHIEFVDSAELPHLWMAHTVDDLVVALLRATA